jgi:sigma-B regulation protein RsbU (phosphoserine phosphatase)
VFGRQFRFLASGCVLFAVLWSAAGATDPAQVLRSGLVVGIYSLCVGNLLTLGMPRLEPACQRQPFPYDWILRAGCLASMSAVASAVAGLIVFVLSLYPPEAFWGVFAVAGRLGVIMGTVVGVVSEMYDRAQARSQQLRQQVEIGHAQLRQQDAEVEKAREIQEGLLPKQVPAIRGCDIRAGWYPAQVIGGDYLGVLKLGDSKAALCIGDVVGKGIPAALLMANLQALVKAFASDSVPPSELCQRVNRALCSSIVSGKFVTFFYGILDTQKRRLVFARAGHDAPILLNRSGRVSRLEAGGPVLGVFPEAAYQQGEVALATGDTLLLFTDGLTEAMNPLEEEFGVQRLVELLRTKAGLTASALKQELRGAVTAFCGGRFADDAALILVRIA